MSWPQWFDGLAPDWLWRVGLAFVAGAVLGIERERRGRAAGLRTTLLVCLAACLVMLLSDRYYHESLAVSPGASWRPDPMRLAAGLLSGMGFLGAGVILHLRRDITRGVTTAATLWFATIAGLCFGAGAHGLGLFATLMALVILWWIPRFEWRIGKDRYGELTLHFPLDAATVEQIRAEIARHDMEIKHLDWREDLMAGERKVRFGVKFRKARGFDPPEDLIRDLSRLAGVRSVQWRG